MNKKQIKINFVDFWKEFDYKNFIFYETLSKKYDVVISDEPDYIFCSCFGSKHRNYNCVKIFYSGENYSTNLNEYDYGIDFDDYQLEDRHFRLPVYVIKNDRNKKMELLQSKHLNYQEEFKQKESFCSFVYSHHVKIRNYFFNELSKYKKVDSGGGVFKNVNIGKTWEDKVAFERKHKFSIAFENTSTPDYITEKLTDSFEACTVPIYYGAKNVTKYFNSEAMLILEDENHIPQLIEKIKEIDNNDELYLKMLSQPALTPEGKKFLDNYEKEFEQFLFNIFDQPLEKAKRLPSWTLYESPSLFTRIKIKLYQKLIEGR